MSGTLLPLEGGRAGATPPSLDLKTGGETAHRARVAKAAREFQALFLMELMKPLTQGISENSTGSPELGTGDRDLYSWFWNEGLAKQLAGSWPLPELPGTEEKAAAVPSPLSFGRPVFRQLARTVATGTAVPARATQISPASPARSSAEPAAVVPASTAVSPASAVSSPSAPAAPIATAPGFLDRLILRASSLFQLPANLVRAVMHVESGGRTEATSGKGAVGLMQVLPSTAREMGARDLTDPWENLWAGAKYLSQQISRFGDLPKALAAYNAGPSAVEEHGGIPPYRETQNYVRLVLEEKARLDQRHPADA